MKIVTEIDSDESVQALNIKERLAAAIDKKLEQLSPEISRNRILSAAESARFWGISLPQWRRLYRSGKVPPPLKIGERKLGWRVGVLSDAIEERNQTTWENGQ